jgi:1-acyl-sn-glycerol-3-phosphate acyltransferase
MFFFEKRSQKTFGPLSRGPRESPRQHGQKFFASVFQKTGPSLSQDHPLAKRSWLLLNLFRLYVRFLVWRKFHAVRLAAGTTPPPYAGRPLVIYCNHPSWWDPAILLLVLPRLFPKRRGFGPMDAVELERYGLFRHMGIFAVERTPRGAAAFLRVARYGLAASDACMGITAEGAFTDSRVRPVRLRPGLAHLARRCPDAVFLPLAMEYVFWNESKPEVLLRFGPPVRAQGDNVAAWQSALDAGLTDAMDALAGASVRRDPDAFVRVFSGTAGVGGIYDVWRRMKAAMRGEKFDPRHEAARR